MRARISASGKAIALLLFVLFSLTASPAFAQADFIATKTNDTGGVGNVGVPFNWSITVTNIGSSAGSFALGDSWLRDSLPNANMNYGTATISAQSGITGSVACSIIASSSTLSCGGPGATFAPNAFATVTFSATPLAAGTFDNPRAGGTCLANSANSVPESNTSNNACSDSVTIMPASGPDLLVTKSNNVSGTANSGTWTWSIGISNGGNMDATFTSGQTILTDNLANTDVTYAAPTVTGQSNISGTGSISCTIVSFNLNCTASGGSVIIGSGSGSFTVNVAAQATRGGTFNNPRAGGICAADPNDNISEASESNNACSDTVTAPLTADFIAAKTNDTGGVGAVGVPFNWFITITNVGDTAGSFNIGSIIRDVLPDVNMSYGTPTISAQSGVTGSFSCSISGASILGCGTANATVAVNGFVTVQIPATPLSSGTFDNPRAGGNCEANPSGDASEVNRTNNSCSDSVTVPPNITGPDLLIVKSNSLTGPTTNRPWNWLLQVSTGGTMDSVFSSGQTIITDNLPNTGITYGTPTVSALSGVSGTGTIDCSIASSDLTCIASGGNVVLDFNTGSFLVTVPAMPGVAGTFVNPRAGGVCAVDPNDSISEGDETNNSCTDSVTVTQTADFVATKTNDTGGVGAVGVPFNWTITATNSGDVAASFGLGGTIIRDNLPNTGMTYGTPMITATSGISGGSFTCSINASSDLTCGTTGANVAVNGFITVQVPATPTSGGVFANPRAGGFCLADASNDITELNESNNSCSDTVTVSADADIAVTKTDGVTSATPGQSLTYTIVVSNNGPSVDPMVTLSDMFPAALNNCTFTSVAAGGATGNTAAGAGNLMETLSMPASSSVTYTVTCDIDAAATGTLSNTATATGSVTDPVPGNNAATDSDTVLTPEADISVTKTDGLTSAVPGQSLTYTIVASNIGPSDDPAVSLNDTLPADLTCTFTSVAAGGATGNTAAGGGDLAETLNMPAGSSVTYTVACNIDAAATGTLSNTATAAGSVTDPVAGNNSATDSDTVLMPEADISITKTDGITSAIPGQSLTYTIVVGNAGPSVDPAVAVADTFPAELTCTYTSVAAGGASGNTAAGSGNLADTLDMPVGSSVTYTVSCDIDSAATGTLSNTATATASVTDPTPGNNTATDDDTVLMPEADVSVTKTDGVTTAIPGQTLTYTIVASNAGPSDDPSVALADTLPTELTCTFTSVAAGGATGNTAAGAGDLAETLSMPSGSSVTYTVDCNIDSMASGTLSNTATVTPSVTDPDTGNNSATDDDTMLIDEADISVTKTDGVTSAVPGQTTLVYTIVISNDGPIDDPSVTLTDMLPAELACTFTSTAAGGATGNTAAGTGDLMETLNMPANSSVTYTVTCSIAADATGTLTNTATGSGSVTDPDPANDSATDDDTVLMPETDLSIEKSDGGVIAAVPGSEITYTLTVTNSGPSDSTGGVVTDVLPAGLSFVSSATGCTEAAGTVTCPFGPLPNGASVELSFVAQVDFNQSVPIVNDASVTANENDPADNNNSSTQSTPVVLMVPSLNVWGMLLMAALLGMLAWRTLGPRQRWNQ